MQFTIDKDALSPQAILVWHVEGHINITNAAELENGSMDYVTRGKSFVTAAEAETREEAIEIVRGAVNSHVGPCWSKEIDHIEAELIPVNWWSD